MKDHGKPWVSQGKVVGVEKGVIFHDADFVHGSSGSPVFLDDTCSISALATADMPGKPKNIATTSINYRLISFIKEHRNQTPN